MQYFALSEQIEQLQAELTQARERERLPLLLPLAWYVRQSDTTHARALAAEGKALIAASDLPPLQQRQHHLRFDLIEAEGRWLFGDLARAKTLCLATLEGFTELDDALGIADTQMVLSGLAVDRGDTLGRDLALHAMVKAARHIDPVRAACAQTALARAAIFRDTSDVKTHLQQCLADLPDDPVAHCAMADLQGIASALCSDFAQAIPSFHQAHKLALATGQIRRAINIASNLGDTLGSLNENQAALEWMQRGLDLARTTGWPAGLGSALLQTARSLHQLRRCDGARTLLLEALDLLTPLAASRNYAVALQYLGDVELDCQEYQSALATFQLLEQRAEALSHPDLQTMAQRGKAHALLHLKRAPQALKAAQRALELAQPWPDMQIPVLLVMAEIHAALSAPAASRNALNCLHQALALANEIAGYAIPGKLFDAIAREYAKQGQFEQAYEFACQANLAREKIYDQEATNRAIALQTQHQTERALAQGEHHRQLAASEAKRAAILQQTGDTLTYLGTIGQEITTHLEAWRVFESLTRHIHHLLDVNACCIYLVSPERTRLVMAFGFENGKPIPANEIALNSPVSDSARAVREQREILVDQDPSKDDPTVVPGTLPMHSALFAPLRVGEQVMGVMSIQSQQRHAYGQREQLIFRNLCAYTAIALANARAHGELAAAHRHLQETQEQMVLQGKMAGLGTLTAGVAHEINNPTNFAHVAAQNMRHDLKAFEHFLAELLDPDEQAMVDAFASHFSHLNQHLATILDGTARIKGIVKDLRAFTRLDEAEKKSARLAECLLSTLHLVRTSWQEKVTFITELKDDPEIECWPALLNQVFMNLLVNACQAIAEKFPAPEQTGVVRIRLREHHSLAIIEFEDNGIGISPSAQAHILEPFFTTKSVGVGTGLGLSIAYGIIEKHDGRLQFTSTPGSGSCFSVMLPLRLTQA